VLVNPSHDSRKASGLHPELGPFFSEGEALAGSFRMKRPREGFYY
jgi:hypothetical protein